MAGISKEAALLICGPVSVALISAYTLFRLAERRSNCLSYLTSVLGVSLSFSIVAVVPYDVWHALAAGKRLPPDGHHGEAQAAQLLQRSWSTIYWTTTVLCYLLFPFLMEFEGSGEFCVKARIRTSFRRYILFYLIYAIVVCVVLVWLIVSGKVEGNLESWCIAASNAWGLLLLTVLMGFGLVGVPRHIWRLACPKEQLRRLYVTSAPKEELRLSRLFELQDAMDQVRAELASCSSQPDDRETPVAFATLKSSLEKCEDLRARLSHGGGARGGSPGRRSGVEGQGDAAVGACGDAGSPLQPCLDSGLAEECGDDTTVATSLSSSSSRLEGLRPSGLLDAGARLRRWAELHSSLKVSALEARRAASRWDDHVQRCLFFEDLDAEHYKAAAELVTGRLHLGFPRGFAGHVKSFLWLCWHKLLVFWLCHLRSRAFRCASYACGALSAVIVLGQMTMLDEGRGGRLSALAYIFRGDRGPWTTQALCVVPLGYMTYTAYFSIFRLRVPGWYGLYDNHNTDMGSLLWCASILARLAAPLCYHFLLLIRVRGTTFQRFMGKMNVVPVLGESFNDVFPCVVVVLCLFNLLNVYSHIVRILSLGTVDFDLAAGAAGDDPLSEGKALVERERRRRTEEERDMELPARERLSVPLAQGAGGAQ